MISTKYKEAINPLLKSIYERDFGLASSFSDGTISESDIRLVIDDYEECTSKKITPTPETSQSEPTEYFERYDSGVKKTFIISNLWFDGEESDLSVELHIDESNDGKITTHLEDIRVM